jgi:hypothetical protein
MPTSALPTFRTTSMRRSSACFLVDILTNCAKCARASVSSPINDVENPHNDMGIKIVAKSDFA